MGLRFHLLVVRGKSDLLYYVSSPPWSPQPMLRRVRKPPDSKGFGRYSIHLSLHFRTHWTHFSCLSSTPSYSHHFHFHFRCKLHSSISNPDYSSAIRLALRYDYSTYSRNPPVFPVSILLEHPYTVKASTEVESRRWGSCLELNLKVQSN